MVLLSITGISKLIKTEKYKPPNRSDKWRVVKKLTVLRDRLYNQGTITQKQINVYSAIIRKTLGRSSKAWIQQTVDRVVRRARRIARRHGKEPLVVIDVPDDLSLRFSDIQRTLRSFARYLENILSWYGIYWKEARLLSTVCPMCGCRMKLVKKTKKARTMKCECCVFRDIRG